MVREQATTSSSSTSSGDASSSSCTSLDASSSSSVASSSSSDSSNSSRGADAKRSNHNRRRNRSQHSKRNYGSRRELVGKHIKERHTSYKIGKSHKKRKKHFCDIEPDGKTDSKKHKRKPKRRKLEKQIESADKNRVAENKRSQNFPKDSKSKEKTNNLLEVKMNAQEQQKALIRRNAELAKARLASGELQRARAEQSKMHQLYGTVDWRARKKLRTEKKILERTVAAGRQLASLEEREYARMDAFRVSLGLPTAEAQRQAEWRAEATQALLELENGSKQATLAGNSVCKKTKHGIIGPTLPP